MSARELPALPLFDLMLSPYPMSSFKISTELRSCVKVEVAVPNKPTVSVDVKQHFNQQLQQSIVAFRLYSLTVEELSPRNLFQNGTSFASARGVSAL